MGSSEPSSLTIRVLQEITDNFSEKHMIGHGSYGKVYKGMHENGEEIAIKVLYNDKPGIDDEQFQHEFDNLVNLKHKNIVRLVGYCYDTQREHLEFDGKIVFGERTYRALCFDYLHNGSLQKHLSDECSGLEWHICYKIINGMCEGLKYLHEGFDKPIYHLDLKPDNILLDENLEPKLADFGLSKIFGDEQTLVAQSPIGTIGYLPMEYLHGNVISKKLDIFSLGVVMIKIIAGPGGHTRSAETPYTEFVDQVHENWRKRLQATLPSSWPLEAYCQQVTICTEIALNCMDTDRHKRPSIVNIINKLNETETVLDEFKHDAESNDKVKIQAFTRTEAIPCAETCNEFAVMVRVTAAPWHREVKMPRAGVDLVAVIDINATISQEKERCMKQAMMSVIGKLTQKDRLSIVTFKGDLVKRRTVLTYMSERGREVARTETTGLTTYISYASGVTKRGMVFTQMKARQPRKRNNMGAALREGAEILRARAAKEGDGRLGFILFLPLGVDAEIDMHEISPKFPVHIFGLGVSDNLLIMKYIADKTSGSYSFVVDNDDIIDRIKDAIELFVAGLASVAATSIKITLRAHEGVAISSIESGGYGHLVGSNKLSGEIDINNIYVGEQKNFIVYVTVAAVKEKLVTVGGRYKTLSASKELACADASVLRPQLPVNKLAIHPEVAAELARIRLEKGISAMMMQEQHPSGDDVQELWERVKDSEQVLGAAEGDLSKEVSEMKRAIEHMKSGVPYMLSWVSCHNWQRATTKGAPSTSAAFQIIEQQQYADREHTSLVKVSPQKNKNIQVKVPRIKVTRIQVKKPYVNGEHTSLVKVSPQKDKNIQVKMPGIEGIMSIKVHALTRRKAIPVADTCNEFPILVQVTGMRTEDLSCAGGVDVVAIIDVSGSWTRDRQPEFTSMQHAMRAVVDKLGQNDRLSIVAFGNNVDVVERCLQLMYMSEEGRYNAQNEIDRLAYTGFGTDMGAALREGAEILRERGADASSRTSCIMLVSDGAYPEIFQQEISPEFPVHTFGLGYYHDPKVMKYMADMTSGTYSFVNQDTGNNIIDAFVQFISGLTSVAATSLKVTIKAHAGVTIDSVESGGYSHLVSSGRSSVEIDINNIYAGERKNFIVYLTVTEGKERLVTVGGRYQSLGVGKELASKDVLVLRPRQDCSPGDLAIHPEVGAELARIRLAKGVSAMLKEYPTGHELQKLWDEIKDSDEGRTAPKSIMSDLGNDVGEMKRNMSKPWVHRKTGLPYMLSWLTSHKWQRPTTKGAPSAPAPAPAPVLSP